MMTPTRFILFVNIAGVAAVGVGELFSCGSVGHAYAETEGAVVSLHPHDHQSIEATYRVDGREYRLYGSYGRSDFDSYVFVGQPIRIFYQLDSPAVASYSTYRFDRREHIHTFMLGAAFFTIVPWLFHFGVIRRSKRMSAEFEAAMRAEETPRQP